MEPLTVFLTVVNIILVAGIVFVLVLDHQVAKRR